MGSQWLVCQGGSYQTWPRGDAEQEMNLNPIITICTDTYPQTAKRQICDTEIHKSSLSYQVKTSN